MVRRSWGDRRGAGMAARLNHRFYGKMLAPVRRAERLER
jgi:hypothetical protein